MWGTMCGQGSAQELPQLRALTGAPAAAQGWRVWNHPSQFVGRCLHPGPSPHGAMPTAALWIYVKTLCMWPCNDFRGEVLLIFIRCLRLWFYKLMEHMSAKAPKHSCCLQKLLADVLLSETLCGKPVLHLVLRAPWNHQIFIGFNYY